MKILIVTLLIVAHAQGKLIWEHPTGNQNPQALVANRKHPEYLHVALKEGGVKTLRVDGQKPKEVGQVTKQQLGGLDAMNLWQHDDLLLVALGNFFQKGFHAGFAILNASDPTQIKVLGTWKSEKPMRGSAVVVCDSKAQHAYLGLMEFGVATIDISKPKAPKLVSIFQPDLHFPKQNPNPIQQPNARGMALKGKTLFLCYDAGGIRALDISAPEKPKEIGQYINTKMGDKPSAYNNIKIHGDLAYAAIDYAGLEVLDIRNPKQIQQVAWLNPWAADTNKNIWLNSPGHTNQIAFNLPKKLLHLSAGDSELVTIDITDPQNPKRLAGYGKPRNSQGVWGLCSQSDMVYLGYIKTIVPFRGSWAGIRAAQSQ